VRFRDILDEALEVSGFAHRAYLGEAGLRELRQGLDGELTQRLGLGLARGCAVVALGYGEGPAEPPAWAAAYPGPEVSIARFARANWYAEISSRLKSASDRARATLAESGMDPGRASDWRRFSNSRMPERRAAVAAGLGRVGRHGLVMVEGHGSAVLLGLLLTPRPIESTEPIAGIETAGSAAGASRDFDLAQSCEGCGECVAACPTGALSASVGGPSTLGRPIFDRLRCLQHWSSVAGALPLEIEAAWGNRLYGCELCQEACPRYRPDPEARCERGPLGPGLPASWLDSASDEEIRGRLKGSALGMAWIPIQALRRSARLRLSRG
jgi:Uncharacterized Fe-S protein